MQQISNLYKVLITNMSLIASGINTITQKAFFLLIFPLNSMLYAYFLLC